MAPDAPRIVEEQRVRAEVRALAQRWNRVVLNERRVIAADELRNHVAADNVGTRAVDTEIASRLVVVRIADVVEVVVPEDHGVRARPLGRQEERPFHEGFLVVACLRRADAAERVGPVPRVVAALIQEKRAVDTVCRIAGLKEQTRREHAAVRQRVERLRVLAIAEAARVHRGVRVEGVVHFRFHDLEEVRLQTVVRRQRVRALALVSLRLVVVRVGKVGSDERAALRLVLQAAGCEKPEAIFDDRTAQRVLVSWNGLVDPQFLVGGVGGNGLGLKRRERAPFVVVVGVAERTGKDVAAGLGDEVHDAPTEASVFRGYTADRYGGLLNRVFDVEVVRRTAKVFGDRDAVHHEQRLE